MAALSTAWSASLGRTSIFLVVLSASGVALGFAAQGDVTGATFRTLALFVLPLVLFLGIATFVRIVQIQREATIYGMGINRIRHYLQQFEPSTRPYYILTAHDDPPAIFRSIGAGMSRRPPRFQLLYMVVQTQGIVGVVAAAVAAAFAGLLLVSVSVTATWIGAGVAFVVVLLSLFTYWQRSITQLQRSIRPINPTPPDDIDAPF